MSSESSTNQPTSRSTKTIKYFICGTIPEEKARTAENNYFQREVNESIANKNLVNAEFKYVCFDFKWEQLKGVIGMCNYDFFLPKKNAAKIKKPLKTKSRLEKSLHMLYRFNPFTRKKSNSQIEDCKSILNNTEHQSRHHKSKEFKKLLDDVISDLNNGHKVELYGFSYGGAVLNALARRIHKIIDEIKNCSQNNPSDTILNIFNNLIIFTFGSVYLYDESKTSNVKIYNIMIVGDFANSCIGQKKPTKLARIHDKKNHAMVLRYETDEIKKYYYIENSNNLYWILPEFNENEKQEKYDEMNEYLNNPNDKTLLQQFKNGVGNTYYFPFRWNLHLSYTCIILTLLTKQDPTIDDITGNTQNSRSNSKNNSRSNSSKK